MKVRDVDPDATGRVRCKCCDNVMPLADVLVSGDSLVCPICGEFERFIDETDEKESEGTTELKPCPFCGADPINLTLVCEEGDWFIYCNECDMIVEHAYPGMSKEELITHWNRRVTEEPACSREPACSSMGIYDTVKEIIDKEVEKLRKEKKMTWF